MNITYRTWRPMAVALAVSTAVLLGLSIGALATRTTAPPAAPVAASSPAPVKSAGMYLAELRNRMPISTTGSAEVFIAQGVCRQLALGVPRASLINDLNAMNAPLAGVNAYYYAVDMVDTATTYYC